ncbi:hypothetical protein J1614_010856 [Plenodomus biglobosus]|nr:hypothetical protein J1614_010856 [Plenodomus biglobosus]
MFGLAMLDSEWVGDCYSTDSGSRRRIDNLESYPASASPFPTHAFPSAPTVLYILQDSATATDLPTSYDVENTNLGRTRETSKVAPTRAGNEAKIISSHVAQPKRQQQQCDACRTCDVVISH